MAVFPIQIFFSGEESQATKLFRLPRMLRMIKLFDTKNIMIDYYLSSR